MYTAHGISSLSWKQQLQGRSDVERPSSAPGHSSQILHKFDGNAQVNIMFAIRKFKGNTKVKMVMHFH
jgi:hypothetical protein